MSDSLHDENSSITSHCMKVNDHFIRCYVLPQVDLLPSDGEQGDGDPRPGKLSAARQKEVGSLKEIVAVWEERLPGAQVLPISALEGINTEKVSGRGEALLGHTVCRRVKKSVGLKGVSVQIEFSLQNLRFSSCFFFFFLCVLLLHCSGLVRSCELAVNAMSQLPAQLPLPTMVEQ